MGEKIVPRDNREIIVKKYHHNWKMKLFIALIMLILSFVGLVLSDVRQDLFWPYWRIMVFVFALLSLFLSRYLKYKHFLIQEGLWHEFIQWCALFVTVFLVFVFVKTGLIGYFAAGLTVLTLLSFNMFIIGIYIERIFCLIGGLLAIFTWGAVFLMKYLYTIILPITVGVAILLVWTARKRL